jgi:hypothetical protein
MAYTSEDEARAHIDGMLDQAGWAVQDLDRYDPGVPERGIAIGEFPFDECRGIYRALDLFDRGELKTILDELNDVVTA